MVKRSERLRENLRAHERSAVLHCIGRRCPL